MSDSRPSAELLVRLRELEKWHRADHRDLTAAGYAEAAATIEHQAETIERLTEALTPSGETKAAYIGEFKFKTCVGFDEDSHDIMVEATVPWTTIKEIMAAIRERTALTTEN